MIISLTGYKQSGKDSVAQTLIKEFGFTRYAFADVIRRCIGDIFLWSPEHMEKEKETIDPRWGVSPRIAMQIFGTELFQYSFGYHVSPFAKKVGRNIWAYRFREWFKDHKDENIVITDLRFPHEYELLLGMGATITRVYRKRMIITGEVHVSERHIMNLIPHFILENNGTLGDLQLTTQTFMKHMDLEANSTK